MSHFSSSSSLSSKKKTTHSAFAGDQQPISLTPEIAAATLRSATRALHGSAGGAALPFSLLSVDSQASTATVRVSKAKMCGGSYSSSAPSTDPVAALVASLACVTRSPQLVVLSSSPSSSPSSSSAAAAERGGGQGKEEEEEGQTSEERTLPPQPLTLTVVRRCSSVASLASDPRSFDPRAEIERQQEEEATAV